MNSLKNEALRFFYRNLYKTVIGIYAAVRRVLETINIKVKTQYSLKLK